MCPVIAHILPDSQFSYLTVRVISGHLATLNMNAGGIGSLDCFSDARRLLYGVPTQVITARYLFNTAFCSLKLPRADIFSLNPLF
jgi:hypothetical protein